MFILCSILFMWVHFIYLHFVPGYVSISIFLGSTASYLGKGAVRFARHALTAQK